MTDPIPPTPAPDRPEPEEPLTAEEEAELRYWVRSHPPSNGQWFSRLLATLDAVRSAPTPEAAGLLYEPSDFQGSEAMAAMANDNPHLFLREALAKGLADALTIDWPGDTRLSAAPAIADYLMKRPAIRSALATVSSQPDRDLDGETLPAALAGLAAWLSEAITTEWSNGNIDTPAHDRLVEAIAARLRETAR